MIGAGCQPIPESSPFAGDGDSGGDTWDGDDPTDATPQEPNDCGNGQPDPGELCDDGNNDDGDGCSADCSEATCWAPATHPTIQAAVDDPGCPTVWLAPQTQHEHVVVRRNLELVGGTISGSQRGRVLEIARGVSVVVRNTSIIEGSAERGGGIYSAGTLELDGVRVRRNDARGHEPCGGGVWSDGTVILRATTVETNRSETGNTSARGAGICMIGGRLELHGGSDISNNSARAQGQHSARGGGIYTEDTDILIASGSRISGNVASVDQGSHSAVASGGSIHQVGGTLVVQNAWINWGRAWVDGEAVVGNPALAEGGAMSLFEVDAHISDSELVDNGVVVRGGVLWPTARGGAIHLGSGTTATLDRTVFEGNSAEANANFIGVETSVLGAAIDIDADGGNVSLHIVDAVFTDNLTRTYASSSVEDDEDVELHAAGGSIFALADGAGDSAVVRIERSTFHDNASDHGGALFLRADDPGSTVELDLVNDTFYENHGDLGAVLGASAVEGEVNVRVRSTTITQNFDHVSGALWVAPHRSGVSIDMANSVSFSNADECSLATAPVVSLGYNIFDAADCSVTPAVGDQFVEFGGLEDLAANGGPTETCALHQLSPARNAGDPRGCLDTDGSALIEDQRGEQRHQGERCDIGAFESSP